jgi:AAA15 family ATPase/GTPase
MEAAKIKSKAPENELDLDIDIENTIKVNEKLTLLRSAVVYGANASGKSNIVKAVRDFQRLVRISATKMQIEDEINVDPFALIEMPESQPSCFEVIFLLNDVRYRYGFSATRKRIIKEWLYYSPNVREICLFTRELDRIDSRPPMKAGKTIINQTRPNALFLSVAAKENVKLAIEVRSWIIQGLHSLDGNSTDSVLGYSLAQLDKGTYREGIVSLVKQFDLDLMNLTVEKKDIPDEMKELLEKFVIENALEKEHLPGKVAQLVSWHSIHDKTGKVVGERSFAASDFESDGTLKLIAYAGPLIDVLINGLTLVIDELDSSLHPDITRAIFELFNSRETNPKNAQLICATHDVSLLDPKLVRRDQVYFVEKDRTANTVLYSLSEIKDVRNTEDYSKMYRRGNYGALPIIGDLKSLIADLASATEDSAEVSKYEQN